MVRRGGIYDVSLTTNNNGKAYVRILCWGRRAVQEGFKLC
jgi:hypothetical protein